MRNETIKREKINFTQRHRGHRGRMMSNNNSVISVYSVRNFIFILAILYMFTACPHEQPTQQDQGAIYLTVTEGYRSIMPTTTVSDFAGYQLKISDILDDYTFLEVPLSASELSNPIFLDTGAYFIRLTAYLEYNNATNPPTLSLPAAEGTKIITVNANVTNDHTIILEPFVPAGAQDGGTFSWNITFDVTGGVTKADMFVKPVLFPGGEFDQYRDLLSNNPGSLSPLATGYYNVVFTLEKDDDSQPVEWLQVLHVYQNMTSHFEYEFTDDHFNDLNCKVTYVYNDGVTNGPLSDSVLHNTTVDEPPYVTKRGYSIEGWYTTPNFAAGTKWDFDDDVVTRDITLYANWKTNTFTPNPINIENPEDILESLQDAVIFKTGYGSPNSHTFTLTGTYDTGSIQWYLNDDPIPGATNASFILNADDHPSGTHFLTVEVEKDGVPYNKTVTVNIRPYPVTQITLKGEITSAILQETINEVMPGTIIILPAGNHTLDMEITVNKDVTIVGTAPETKLTSSASVAILFTVTDGATLTLGSASGIPLILDGNNQSAINRRRGVSINSTSELVMYNGVKITGFKSNNSGAGIAMFGGSFTMYGGIIENNNTTTGGLSLDGGGVYLDATGVFNMYDGWIKNNTSAGRGGGVYSAGTFRMYGGTITGTGHVDANTSVDEGAALYRSGGTAQYGNGTTITSPAESTITGIPAP